MTSGGWRIVNGAVAISGLMQDGYPKACYVVLSFHMFCGMTAHGPFTTEQSAKEWLNDYGRDEIEEEFGERTNWTHYVERMIVPHHFIPSSE